MEIASRVQFLVMLFLVVFSALLVAYSIKSSKITPYSNAFSRKIKETSVSPTTLIDTGCLSAPESRYPYCDWIIFSSCESWSVRDHVYQRNFKNLSLFFIELSWNWDVGAGLRLRQPKNTTFASDSELL